MLAALGLWLTTASVEAAAPKRSFPQHAAYKSGAVLPSHRSRSDMDAKIRQFYTAWKTSFIRQGCGTGRYYAYLGPQSLIADGTPLSVSEAQGYAMMIMVYMAGADSQAQTIFDGLYRFYKDHPSQHDAALMAWRQVTTCNSTSDPNSASDGDIDIAYALLLAHSQWGSTGAVNYRSEALKILTAIRKREVHPKSRQIQMGDWVHPSYPLEYNAVRTSDVMPVSFRAFAKASGDSGWTTSLDAGYKMLQKLQSSYAPSTGLVPEFAIDTHGSSPKPAASGFVGDWLANTYSMNACRVPWRIGIDFLLHGDSRAKTVVGKMLTWLNKSSGGNIYKIYGGYELNGRNFVGYNYVCFTGAFGVAAMTDKKYQTLVNKIWDDIAITYVDTPQDHYGASLRLLYMLAMSGNIWTP